MDLQDSPISSLPVPLVVEIFSIWDEKFNNLSYDRSKFGKLYGAAEFSLISFMMRQITKGSQEECQHILKNIPLFQKTHKNLFVDEEEEQSLFVAFRPALVATQHRLDQAKVKTLPITFLGQFYERFGIASESENEICARNATGSFYTPVDIAQFIITKTIEIGNFLDSIKSITCLDPACGGGVFLVTLAETLLQREMSGTKKIHNVIVDCIRNILSHQVWGIDLSSNAQRISQLQLILWALSRVPNVPLEEICSWVIHCNQGDFLSSTCETLSNFSVIVGNPPFGNLLSDAQKESAKSWATTRPREISELFLERSLRILNSGGCLGFIMPKTMAYYAQWAKARALILPAKLAGVADLGLSFSGVNFETLALFVRNSPADISEDHFPIFNVGQGLIGTFPRSYIHKTDLIPLQPLTPGEETFLATIRNNSLPVSHFAQGREVTRGVYLSEELKGECVPGNCLWINRVPDIQHYSVKLLWAVDPGVISRANLGRFKVLQCPKVLLKVLRGKKISGIPDPWGFFQPTEKLVSILLDKSSPREILAWNACLNSWPASYYLQKIIFSETTESARVLDYPYLKHVPVLLHTSRTVNVLSDIQLALLLATQIHIQRPSLIPPRSVSSLGIFFQQVAFLSYAGDAPNDPILSLEGDFDTNLQLWRDFLITGAKKPPIGGLSRINLAKFDVNQEPLNDFTPALEISAQNFARGLGKLLSQNILQKYDSIVKQSPQWHQLFQYFKSKF